MPVHRGPWTQPEDDAAIANLLGSIQADFLACTRERVERIATLAAVSHLTGGRAESLQQLVRDAHTIKGSAATFGFPTLGTAAAVVERAGRAELEGGREGGSLDRAVEVLAEALDSATCGTRSRNAVPQTDG